ncbi:hypothetical protein AGMMS4952_06030 [Spirochaetia bacterium]|nr:hypothetical protein AGMMS4952_06030 [Spirochaetia bacterium]
MKKMIAFLAVLCAMALSSAAAQSQPVAAELSFSYTRQGGSGSNQFAAWIEDARGNYVKTLYATRFTASGGWERRPLSILQWVKQSGLAKLSKPQIDAFTGPTPKPGKLTYRWDGTNQAGAAVPAGEYRLFLEATLRNENRVVYSAVVPHSGSSTGARRNAEVKAEYFGNANGTDTAEREMIGGVQVLVGE